MKSKAEALRAKAEEYEAHDRAVALRVLLDSVEEIGKAGGSWRTILYWIERADGSRSYRAEEGQICIQAASGSTRDLWRLETIMHEGLKALRARQSA